MSSIWFFVSVPGKNGFLWSISAKMQPTLHISTDVVYCWALNSNSGARYHLVATYSVSTFAFKLWNKGLANPKSQILRSQLELTNRFLGFCINIILLNLCEQFELNEYILILSKVDIKRTYSVLPLMTDHSWWFELNQCPSSQKLHN